jgi:hypothetical protein
MGKTVFHGNHHDEKNPHQTLRRSLICSWPETQANPSQTAPDATYSIPIRKRVTHILLGIAKNAALAANPGTVVLQPCTA